MARPDCAPVAHGGSAPLQPGQPAPSASDTSSQPPSLSRASPPRHTRSHMVLGHKVEAAGPGACSPRLAAGGRATPSQGQLLRLALPSRAAPTAGRAWTGRLASGTSRLSPSAQHFCSPPPGRPPPAAASPGHLRGGLRLGAVRSPLRAGGGGLSQAAPGLREGWTRAGCRARPNSASPTNPRGSSGGGRRAGGQAVTSGGDQWASSSAWAPSWAPVGPG